MDTPSGGDSMTFPEQSHKQTRHAEDTLPNTVLANTEFYFKGVRYAPSAVIDMDVCMRHAEPMVQIYQTLASENGIGLHSYEFDVMVMEAIEFTEPSGLVAGFLNDGALDLDGLHQAWQQQKIHNLLQPIAHRHMGIENLDDHPALKAALIEAYLSD